MKIFFLAVAVFLVMMCAADAAEVSGNSFHDIMARETLNIQETPATPVQDSQNPELQATSELPKVQNPQDELENDKSVLTQNEFVTVAYENYNERFKHPIYLIPVKKSLDFPVGYVDIQEGNTLRIRNMYTHELNKSILIHSADGIFDDHAIDRKRDMFIQFNKPGTYTFELYDAGRSNGNDLVPFKGGPSVMTVVVDKDIAKE